jgi:3,4-dihydroxy 2-butanone 4-phosphate synthase/GTP cyclohydrolase II
MGEYPLTAVRGAEANLPTDFGAFRITAYRDIPTGKEHAAIVKGDIVGAEDVLCRIHSECLTGDILHSRRCDCGAQLTEALHLIEARGQGVILYLRQEGRGIGLIEKIKAYSLQENGLDTVDANLHLGHPEDARSYEAARDILIDLGVASIHLLTNNPAKIDGMRELGFSITGVIPLEVGANDGNRDYLRTKKERMGHDLPGL